MPIQPDPAAPHTTDRHGHDTGSSDHTTDHADRPRVHEFTADGPIDATIQNLRGAVTVRAEEVTAVTVTLTPRGKAGRELIERMAVRCADGRLTVDVPAGEADHLSTGLGDLLRGFGAGESGSSWADRLAGGVRNLVRGAEGLVGELAIDVVVPAGSSAIASTGAGDVGVGGDLARLEVKSGAGDLRIERSADHRTRLTTGTGNIVVDGPATGDLSVHSGAGDVTLQRTDGQVEVFTGVGDITVTCARSGRLSARTGLGDTEVRVASGTAARLDLATGFGDRDVQLTPTDGAGAAERTLEIDVKSSKGDLRVVRA